jgi:hypothetical protein
VFVADCEWDEVKLSWVDADRLEIAYPASACVTDRRGEAFYCGRVIKIAYRPHQDK